MTGKRIRPASPLDLLPFSLPPQVALRLNMVQQLLCPHRPWWELLSTWLPSTDVQSILLYQGEQGLLACGQAGSLFELSSWEVRYLAAWEAGIATIHQLWEDLLLALGQEAGRHRALRLLAALPDETHLEPFVGAGFAAYSQETILSWSGGQLDRANPDLQPLTAQHLWAVQQLYQALTPPRVQQTEGRDSQSWQLQRGEEGWVWLQDEAALAYLRLQQGPHGVVLRLLLDPAYYYDAPAVLAYGLRGLQPPVYLVLRGYQGDLIGIARRLGFQPWGQQVLLCKHLAVPSKQAQSLSARTAERQLGTVPGTPSIGRA
ncbi:MAG: hypothetical protein JXA37_02825 [Chloroflexia bacterium]|nr:hypothetical protein [Chloroflexia bacterium]